jgi:hypothetical protein
MYLFVLGLFSILKPKLISVIFKNTVYTSKRTPHLTVAKISWLMFYEIIAVYSDSPLNALHEQNAKLQIVNSDGTKSYHRALNG